MNKTHSRRKDKFTIGKAIKRLRVEKGLTQAQLGDAVGKADSTVRMWELGSSEPDNATIAELAEVFGVSVDCLFGREGDMTAEPRTPSPNRLKELREAKGLTLRELADALEMDYSTFGHIERGRREFSVDSLQRACDYFGVSMDYMLMRDSETVETTPNEVNSKETLTPAAQPNKLRELREARELTLRELAEALGMDYSTLSYLENGRCNFSIDSLLRICDHFGVSTDYMLARDKDASEEEPEAYQVPTERANRLRELRTKKGLTSNQLGEIIKMGGSAVRSIERGDRGLSFESLQRACDYFGVSMDYMLMRTNNAEPEEYPEMPEWKNRLRELREAAGLTSAQLGELIGLAESAVRYIERGEREFSIESLKRACDYFKVTPNVMLGITEAKPQSETTRRESDAVLSKSNKYIRTSKSTGYMEAYYPESPMAKKDGWVLLHRLVMSLSIGRPLTNEEVVHHINGDPGDNRLSNLQLFSNNAEHLKWHAEERRNEIIKSLLEQ